MNTFLVDHGRPRRSASVPCPDVTKKRCPLLLVADHRFHKALGHDRVSSTVHHLVSKSTQPRWYSRV